MNIKTANRLIQLRKEHGYSQNQLAEKLNISRQAISKWERGEASPDTDNLIALSKLYGITLDELLEGVKEEKEVPEEKNTVPFFLKYVLTSILSALLLATYLVLGFVLKNGFVRFWPILLWIPAIYSIPDAIEKKRFCDFLIPLPITAVYCFLGMNYGLWHPYWFLFLLIPVYYFVFDPVDKWMHRNEKEKD